MAELTIQKIALTGLDPTLSAPTATTGDKFRNSGKTFLEVKNGSASSINVTITGRGPCDQGITHDLVVAVAASKTVKIGPFSKRRFDDGQEMVSFVCSVVASVQVAAVELP